MTESELEEETYRILILSSLGVYCTVQYFIVPNIEYENVFLDFRHKWFNDGGLMPQCPKGLPNMRGTLRFSACRRTHPAIRIYAGDEFPDFLQMRYSPVLYAGDTRRRIAHRVLYLSRR